MRWQRNTSNRSQSNGMVQQISSLGKQQATSGLSFITQLTLDVGVSRMVLCLAVCSTAFPSSLDIALLTFSPGKLSTVTYTSVSQRLRLLRVYS